jgi:hypothetical protein
MAKRKGRSRPKKASRKTVSRKRAPARARSRSVRKPARKATSRRAASRTTARTKARVKPNRAKPSRVQPKRKVSVARPKPPALQRERRRLPEEVAIPSAPSTLGYSPKSSSAETGHSLLHKKNREHTGDGPALTAGELDADWNEAYASGEETPGGDMPTPDQDVVEEIGRALGIEYEDAEELKGADKVSDRDRHRWEYDPASSEDYRDRNKKS